MPPQALDACHAALVRGRLPKLLVDDSHLRRGRLAVSYGRKPEEVARKLRAFCMKDEGSAHSKDATEKTGFEDDIVSRGSLTGTLGRGCGLAGGRRGRV